MFAVDSSIKNRLRERGARAKANILLPLPYWIASLLTGLVAVAAILVLEMKDRHNVIFHLMIAGIVAVLVSALIDKKSLYDHLKHQYLHDFNKEETAMETPVEKLNLAQ